MDEKVPNSFFSQKNFIKLALINREFFILLDIVIQFQDTLQHSPFPANIHNPCTVEKGEQKMFGASLKANTGAVIKKDLQRKIV